MQLKNDDNITLEVVVVNFKKVVNYLKARWIGLVIAIVLGIAASLAYSYTRIPKYTAVLSFVLEDNNQSSGGLLSGLSSQFGIDGGMGGGAFSGANIIAFMQSRYLVQKTLLTPVNVNNKRTCLAEVYIDSMQLRDKWEDPHLKNIHFSPDTVGTVLSFTHIKVLGNLYNMIVSENLHISQRDKKSSIMAVEVTSKSEVFSKLFAETLSDVVSQFYIETKSKKARTNVEILERQADSIRSMLDNAINDVASLNDFNYNLNPSINRKRSSLQQRTIDVQVNTTLLPQIVSNLEIARITLLKETPLIQVIDRPVYPLYKSASSLKMAIIIGIFLGVFIFLLFTGIAFVLKWYNKIGAV